MKIILSPAKSQDFETKAPTTKSKTLSFPRETKALVANLQQYTKGDLMNAMKISEKLAELNHEHYADWTKAPKKQALFAFTGDVYQAFMDYSPSSKELNYLEKNLRIISGLYGVLTPLTPMKPYRLEMGRKIPVTYQGKKYRNLYEFWKEKITDYFFKEELIINLASNEYAKVIDTSKLKGKFVNIIFKTEKAGVTKVIALFAKRERGNMALWMAQNNITKLSDLKKYSQNGYRFNKSSSDENTFVFVRKN